MPSDPRRSFPVDLTTHVAALQAALDRPSGPPAGRLLGLPELADGDLWCDIAGAVAITGVAPKTITGWITRRGPARHPFPQPDRVLYRLYWSVASVRTWLEDYQPGRPPRPGS